MLKVVNLIQELKMLYVSVMLDMQGSVVIDVQIIILVILLFQMVFARNVIVIEILMKQYLEIVMLAQVNARNACITVVVVTVNTALMDIMVMPLDKNA